MDKRVEECGPGVTIGIASRNRIELLCRSLELTRDAGVQLPTLIYDDASTPAYADDARLRAFPDLRVLTGRGARDVAAGRNALAAACETEFLFYLDDDTYPITGRVLAPALELLQSRPEVGLVTFLYTEDRETELPEEVAAIPCSSMIGGASIIRVEALRKVGGFSEVLGYACEDTEFAWRMIGHGYEVVRMPIAWILHDHFATPRDQRWSERRYARNILLMHWIHFPAFLAMALAALRSALRLRRSPHVGYYLAGMVDAVRAILGGQIRRTVMPTSRWIRVLRHERA